MVTVDELLPVIKELIAKQKTLEKEIVDLRKTNTSLRRKDSKGIIHSMSPRVKEMLEDEELLSSPILQRCIDCIIASNKGRV